MSGNRTGGLKSATKVKARYGDDFYAKIGHIGGSRGTTGGFASNLSLAKTAGSLGGAKSKRGKNHYYILTENANHKKPTFDQKPKTAQGWRRFFKKYFPDNFTQYLEKPTSHTIIITRLQNTYGVKFKEISQ